MNNSNHIRKNKPISQIIIDINNGERTEIIPFKSLISNGLHTIRNILLSFSTGNRTNQVLANNTVANDGCGLKPYIILGKNSANVDNTPGFYTSSSVIGSFISAERTITIANDNTYIKLDLTASAILNAHGTGDVAEIMLAHWHLFLNQWIYICRDILPTVIPYNTSTILNITYQIIIPMPFVLNYSRNLKNSWDQHNENTDYLPRRSSYLNYLGISYTENSTSYRNDIIRSSGRPSQIEVGTSSGTFNVTDFQLGNMITTLSRGGISVGGVSVSGNNMSFVISQTLTNNTGADVTLNEAGLFSDNNTSDRRWMVMRQVFNEPVTLIDGDSITVSFTIGATC